MTQLEKWQPKFKVPTARSRKAREGYQNIGHPSGRQSLAHGYTEQMEKGATKMNDVEKLYKAFGIRIEKRGPVDLLTGGRVKFEDKPSKQYDPKSVDWTGRELQVRGQGLGRALGAKKTVTPSMRSDQTKRATEKAGLDYASKAMPIEKVAGLGAIARGAGKAAGAAKKAASGAAKKLGGGGGEQASVPSVYDRAKVSSGPTPAIDTSVYGPARERVRTDVTEAQRAQRTGDPVREKRPSRYDYRPQSSGGGGARGAAGRLGGAIGRGAKAVGEAGKEFDRGFWGGASPGDKLKSAIRNRGGSSPKGGKRVDLGLGRKSPTSAYGKVSRGQASSKDWKAQSRPAGAQQNVYNTPASQRGGAAPTGRSATSSTPKSGAWKGGKWTEKAMISLQKFLDDDCGCDGKA